MRRKIADLLPPRVADWLAEVVYVVPTPHTIFQYLVPYHPHYHPSQKRFRLVMNPSLDNMILYIVQSKVKHPF